jgi:hypothetical protein
MVDDYKRAICGFCPVKSDCDGIRWGIHCGSCQKALVCAATDELAKPTCDFIKAKWKALPCKCPLVGSLLKQYPENHSVFQGAAQGEILCPRCGLGIPPTAINVEHGWMPIRGRVTKYKFHCVNCSLDVELQLD